MKIVIANICTVGINTNNEFAYECQPLNQIINKILVSTIIKHRIFILKIWVNRVAFKA